jgi:hypothetical protein
MCIEFQDKALVYHPTSFIQILDLEASRVRRSSGRGQQAMLSVCTTIAAAVVYRKREITENVDIPEGDKKFYNEKLKPILEFIVFVIQYFPTSTPSDETIRLWRFRKNNTQAKIKVYNIEKGFQEREIQIDSARNKVQLELKLFETVINNLCEQLTRGSLTLTGQLLNLTLLLICHIHSVIITTLYIR